MKSVLFFLTVVFFLQPISAQEKVLDNPGDFRVKFAKQADATRTIKSSFVQLKHSAYFKNPLKSTGIFYYDQSGKMRWEQIDPEKHVILIDQEELRILSNGKENKYNLSSNKQLSFIKLLMMGTVNGDLLSSGKFDIAYYYTDQYYRLELVPKDRKLKSMFASIHLQFDKAQLRLERMKLIEEEGEFTEIQFINPTFNAQISQSIYSQF